MIRNADDCLLCGRCNVGILSALILLGQARISPGQVVLDGKFGTSGALTGPNYNISSELGSVRGNNLFHSFNQFDLKAGDVAGFSGPANIQNILSRVTGGNLSSIDGTIRSDIAGANFFLINPRGVIFGPNAKVDVSGSFAFSSADYLKLADGARFVAALDADDSVLSTAPVSAFGFIGSNPGSIQLQQSTVEAIPGQGISLIGGDISLDGSIVRTASGPIHVASVKSPGEVPVDPSSTTGADFLRNFPEKGSIRLRELSKIDASGEGGGRIVIRGGSLAVENSKIESNTTGAVDGLGIEVAVSGAVDLTIGQINSLSPAGLAASGNIDVEADSIRMDGQGLFDEFFNPSAQIAATTGELFIGGGSGKGGDISIHTGKLELINSAQVSVATFGAGIGGRISIEAKSVELDTLSLAPAQITANSNANEGGGNAGDIFIKTDRFELRNGGNVLAASFGNGNGGAVNIDALSLNIFSGSTIAVAAIGSGAGGNIQINAGTMRVSGLNELGAGDEQPSGVQAVTTSEFSPAPGGSIRIIADSLEMDHQATIFASSFGLGQGGDVEVRAGKLTMTTGSTFSAAGMSSGAAGTLSINSDTGILLTSGSSINTSAPGSSGGDISVKAGSDLRLENSEINAQAGLNGGNITVSAADLIYLLNSRFTAQADTTASGFGNGGNLTIEQPSTFLILNNSGLISKSSLGNGGNITILSDYFFESESLIDASAPFGLPGTVVVTAPQVDLSGILVALPGNLLDAETLLRPDCAIRLSDNVSSFIVLGRGGLPIQPGGFLPSGMAPLRNEPQ